MAFKEPFPPRWHSPDLSPVLPDEPFCSAAVRQAQVFSLTWVTTVLLAPV